MANQVQLDDATADGNDLAAHEMGYNQFVDLTVIGIIFVVSVLIGLAIGGVLDRWLLGAVVIVAAAVTAAYGLWSGSRGPSVAVALFALLSLALTGLG